MSTPSSSISSRLGTPTTVHADFLYTNSTSHVSPLSAFAELVDNSKDADAKRVCIDYEHINGVPVLIIKDDGTGMDFESLQNCMNLGFTKKSGEKFIGQYGNGFKSSYRKLGKNVIVASKWSTDNRTRLGFLSQDYLTKTKTEQMMSICCEDMDDHNDEKRNEIFANSFAEKGSWIMQNCSEHFFRTNQRSARKEKDITGTIIYIWGLSESLDFELENDIRVWRPQTQLEKFVDKKFCPDNSSLRNYLVFLYQSPKMVFYVRGKPVRSYLIIKEISEKLTYDIKYRTEEKLKPDGTLVKSKTRGNGIIFGQTTKFQQSGINYYYKGRLIKSFVKIGELKKKGDSLPIIGIVDVSEELSVNHSKTDFADNKESSKLESQIKEKLKRYIKESGLKSHNDTTGELNITSKRKSMNSISASFLALSKNSENQSGKRRMHDDSEEQLTNVQCVSCLKWRAISEEQGKIYVWRGLKLHEKDGSVFLL